MANDLTAFFGNQPPVPADLADALGALGASKRTSTGKPMLKFSKAGEWLLGVEQEEVEEGSTLIVNPASFEAGFVAFHGGTLEDEKMWPIFSMPSDAGRGLPPVKAEQGWQAQLAFTALLDGVEVVFKTSSIGGQDAVKKLAGEVAIGVRRYPNCYPQIQLGSDSYKHKKYGLVHKPLFELTGWVNAAGKPVKETKQLL